VYHKKALAIKNYFDNVVVTLLPAGANEEQKKRFLGLLKEGKLDERRLEVFDSRGRRKTVTVKDVRESLYKEECAKLTDR
jgi:hypothetical protein